MANLNRYSTPVVHTYPFSEDKMLQDTDNDSNSGSETNNVSFRRNKNIEPDQGVYILNGSLEANVDGAGNLDTIADSLPLFRERPVKRRTTGVDRRERSRKCLSVGAFACPPAANPRISMYELGDYGWINQEGVDRKNVLNLDAEINDIIQNNTVAEVNLGHIKIMF